MDVSNQLYLALCFFRDLQGMSRILSQCLLCQMVPPSQGDLKSSLKSKCLFCAPHLFFLKTLGFCSISSTAFVRERKVQDLPCPHLWDFSTYHTAKLSAHQLLFWGSWYRHRYFSTQRQITLCKAVFGACLQGMGAGLSDSWQVADLSATRCCAGDWCLWEDVIPFWLLVLVLRWLRATCAVNRLFPYSESCLVLLYHQSGDWDLQQPWWPHPL